ncbi:MAG: glycogen/starch synthase [Candidatus Taylorbacteria bacterium]
MKLFKTKQKCKILFVATELKPFASVGGLGAVMYALPKVLNASGFDVRAMIPRYLNIQESERITMEYEGLEVPTDNTEGDKHLICNVKKYTSEGVNGSPVTTYFLENMEYYEQRANVYGYADDPIRWALLSRGVLEFLKVSEWVPDVIVAADWQTGLLPNYLKTIYKGERRLQGISTIFSIHNLGYQGNFNHRFLQESDYDDGHSLIPAFSDPRLMKMNGIRRGIMYADAVNTVSPTYSKEILTPEFGEGMDALLNERRGVVHGILNGIDYKVWNSEKDPLIENSFSLDDLGRRSLNKAVIQNRFSLKEDPDTFLVSIVSRLTPQKGFDIVMPVLESLLKEMKMQVIIVGDGDEKYMQFFQDLHTKFPNEVGVELKFSQELPHSVFAGADAVLIPSLFEPSGLTQMEAMHYGAIPIVRKTGGLADTVSDYSPKNAESTGFVFEKFDSSSLLISVVRAYENFQNKKIWRKIQKGAMEKDFSWENSAKKYEKLIEKAMKIRSDMDNPKEI